MKNLIPYIAFLRSIVFSGQNNILSELLHEVFASLGYSDIKIHLQSGNVAFSSNGKNPVELSSKISEELSKVLEYKITVIIKSMDDIKGIIENNPFQPYNKNENIKKFVTFLLNEPEEIPEIPFFNLKSDIQVIGYVNNAVYSLGLPVSKNKHGFPNNFIERKFKSLATTRNFNTLYKLSAQLVAEM